MDGFLFNLASVGLQPQYSMWSHHEVDKLWQWKLREGYFSVVCQSRIETIVPGNTSSLHSVLHATHPPYLQHILRTACNTSSVLHADVPSNTSSVLHADVSSNTSFVLHEDVPSNTSSVLHATHHPYCIQTCRATHPPYCMKTCRATHPPYCMQHIIRTACRRTCRTIQLTYCMLTWLYCIHQ